MGAKIYDKLVLFCLLTFLAVGWSDIFDWRDHMEDAFADGSHSEEACMQNLKDKFIFCRYQPKDNKSLSTWQPCLCTHVLILDEPHTQKIRVPQAFKSMDKDKKIVASISFASDEKLNAFNDFQQLLASLSHLQINGVDMRLEHAEGVSKMKILKYIEDIVSLLKTEGAFEILGITLQRNMMAFLQDHQFLKIASSVDFLSFVPPLPHRSSEGQSEKYDPSHVVDLLLKSGFPRAKLLMPISLRQQMKNVMKETFKNEMNSAVCQYMDNGQNKSVELPRAKDLNLMADLRNQARYILDQNVAGIDIWSINDDDEDNICGKNHFPLIRQISESIKNEKDSFNSFVDLDITLSTGESQITEEVQVLHERNTDPEEMRQFKCEKIGFYRHPTDCSKFYHCAEYRATSAQPQSQHTIFVYKCPRGLVYDEQHGSCDWPSNSEPCKGSAEIMPVPPKKFKCTVPGFQVHPVDCRWFYYCSDLGDGKLAAFEFLCPSHLLGFDENNLLCNWKWLVPQCENEGQENFKSTADEPHNPSKVHPDTSITQRIPKGLNVNTGVTETVIPISVANSFEGARNIPLDVLVPNHKQETYFGAGQASVNKAGSTSDTSHDLKNKTVTFVNFTDMIPASLENSEYKPKNPPPVVHGSTRNNTEKKYGTAYWHRSMVPNRSRVQIPASVFDVIIEEPRGPISSFDKKSNSKINNEDISSKEHRYGIGRVRKLNTRPVSNQRVKEDLPASNFKEETNIFNQDDVTVKDSKHISNDDKTAENHRFDDQNYKDGNLQGRAVSEDIFTNYEFDVVNHHENPKNYYEIEGVRNQQRNLPHTNSFRNKDNIPKNPENPDAFTRIKCSKLTSVASTNDPTIADENTFGCTGEVSLFVKMKPGKEFSKYVLKTSDVSNSAHQESKQFKLLVNNTGGKNDFNVRSLHLENTDESVPNTQIDINNKAKTSSRYTHGRSLSKDVDFTSSARSAPLKLEAIRLDDQENVSTEKTEVIKHNFEKENSLELNNFQYSLRHEKGEEKETLTINTKAKFMPLSFYPQGVLLNVDLNHINEIPPQILLEVDIMLKKFMKNGNIDVNLLMKKLNATMEPMENVSQAENVTNDKIDSMLNMLENILNSSDSKSTESYKNVSDVTFTSDIDVNSTTEEVPYENITNFAGIFNNDANLNVTTSDVNDTNSFVIPTQRKNEKNTQTEEVHLPIHENKPFVRRRLFRKYRYPTIREQLEIQKLLSSYRTTTQAPLPSPTKNSKVVANRSRYPSIREQLSWSNNAAFGNSINSLANPKENPSTPAIEFDDEKGYSSYSGSDGEEFGKRIRITERNDPLNFQTKDKPSSINELVNRNLPTNIPKDSFSPRSSQDTAFYPPHTNANNFEPHIISDKVKNTHFSQNSERYPSQNITSNTPRFQYTLPLSPLPYSKDKALIPSYSLSAMNHFNVQNKIPVQYSRENHSVVSQDLSTSIGYSSNHNHESVPYTRKPPIAKDEVRVFNFQSNPYSPHVYPGIPKRLLSGELHPFNYFNVESDTENPEISYRELNGKGNHTFLPQDLGQKDGIVRNIPKSPSDSHRNKENSYSLRGTSHYNPEKDSNSPKSISSNSRSPHNHESVPLNPNDFPILPPNLSQDELNYFHRNNPGSSYSTAERPLITSQKSLSEINPFNHHQNVNGNSDGQTRNWSNTTHRRKTKSKKLRILVKKVPNDEGKSDNVASRRTEQDTRTRIPKKLLTEIRTNLVRKLAVNGKNDVELEIQFQDHVWNIPFVNNPSLDISPAACTRAGLFQHPTDCNMFYECFWDKWLNRFTLHVFSCPVRLVFDDSIRGCSRPATQSSCRN